jgi:hypothetical protein
MLCSSDSRRASCFRRFGKSSSYSLLDTSMAGGWQQRSLAMGKQCTHMAPSLSRFLCNFVAVNSPVNLVTSKRSDSNTQDAAEAFSG